MSDTLVMLLAANMDVDMLADSIGSALIEKENREGKGDTCSVGIQKIYYLGRLKFLLVLIGSKVNRIQHSEEMSYLYDMGAEMS